MSGFQGNKKSLYALSVKVRTGIKRKFLGNIRKTSKCWIWLGKPSTDGYGTMVLNRCWTGDNTNRVASRVAYELFVGEIERDLQIDHLCRNRICVNPKHLEVVTCRENVLRGNGPPALNSRKTHCKRGHPFTSNNTYIDRKGKQCRICRTYLNRRYRESHRHDPICMEKKRVYEREYHRIKRSGTYGSQYNML